MGESSRAFISYRRKDSFSGTDFQRRVEQALRNLGFDEVFIDVGDSGAHEREDFESKLLHAIETCDLFVALIGKNWLDLIEQKKDGYDAVVLEVYAATFFEKEILPILVDGAAMPERLPREIADFQHRTALKRPLLAADTVETIQRALEEPAKRVLKSQKLYAPWGWYYTVATAVAYFFCGVLTHVVGTIEYGAQAWWGMAAIWGGFFIWPMLLFPFALFGIYRPFNTIFRFVVRSNGFWRRCSYGAPLIVSTILAAVTWAVEVHDPREVPWTIKLDLPQPGCRSGPPQPEVVAALSPEQRKRWLEGDGSIDVPPGLSPQQSERWRVIINLSSYDASGSLQSKYGSDVPFWLTNKCWPNVFYYLTTPIYSSSEALVLNDSDYATARKPIQQSFERALLNGNRDRYRIRNSWTSWVYRVSFFIIAWTGISGVSMAIYFTMVSLRDPDDDSIRRTPREDALLCLNYSMATVMTWIPFRMITEYVKYLYTCPDISDDFARCAFDITLYMPDLLLTLIILVGFSFVTIAMMRENRRTALALYSAFMAAAALSCAFAVYHFHEQVALLAGYWQFYLVVAIPSIMMLLSLWYLFDPSAVRFRDFQSVVRRLTHRDS